MTCSLFSQVFEFEDQEATLQTAKTAQDEILNVHADTTDEDYGFTNSWDGRLPTVESESKGEPRNLARDVNRRDLLCGGRAGGQEAGSLGDAE